MPKHTVRRPTKKRIPQPKLLMVMGIGLSVVAFWRGAWGLMDLYVFPNDPTLSYVASFVIGLLILYLSNYLIRELL